VIEERTETELAAEVRGFVEIDRRGRPAAAEQEVEGETFGENVVGVELRHEDDAPEPEVGPEARQVEAVEEEQPAAG
jgi:hypothetical protein